MVAKVLALGLAIVLIGGAVQTQARTGQRRAIVPGLAADGLLPTPAATPARTPYPADLPCGDILAPVDKEHQLPPDCAPGDLAELPPDITIGVQYLRAEAAAAFESMVATAAAGGYQLKTNSSYRSYQTQIATFDWWVSQLGLDQAERTSARAGHSEHQLGTTADVCAPAGCLDAFSGSPEAAWVAAHSWEFGFLVSYPDEKEAVTGYTGEPWHIRYVGTDVAAAVRSSGLTLHEYLLR